MRPLPPPHITHTNTHTHINTHTHTNTHTYTYYTYNCTHTYTYYKHTRHNLYRPQLKTHAFLHLRELFECKCKELTATPSNKQQPKSWSKIRMSPSRSHTTPPWHLIPQPSKQDRYMFHEASTNIVPRKATPLLPPHTTGRISC